MHIVKTCLILWMCQSTLVGLCSLHRQFPIWGKLSISTKPQCRLDFLLWSAQTPPDTSFQSHHAEGQPPDSQLLDGESQSNGSLQLMAQLCYIYPKSCVSMVEITSLDSGPRLYSFASQLRCLPTTGAWGAFPNIIMLLSFCNAKSKNNAYPRELLCGLLAHPRT